jgi:hypothetical protein
MTLLHADRPNYILFGKFELLRLRWGGEQTGFVLMQNRGRFGDVDWIHWAQDRDRWRALVNTVMNLRVP